MSVLDVSLNGGRPWQKRRCKSSENFGETHLFSACGIEAGGEFGCAAACGERGEFRIPGGGDGILDRLAGGRRIDDAHGVRRQGRQSERTGEREISGDPPCHGGIGPVHRSRGSGRARASGRIQRGGRRRGDRGLTVQQVLPRELMALALALRDELQALR